MSEEDDRKPRTRRGRRGRRLKDPKCQREGCGRPREEGWSCCSQICGVVLAEMEIVERLCRRVGPNTQTKELWTELVELNDLLTSVKDRTERIYAR